MLATEEYELLQSTIGTHIPRLDGGILYSLQIGLRKEMSVTYQPSSWPVSFDLGYSISVGPTGTIRYVIPL